MHDGFSDSVVFISVYLHMAGRLVWQGGHPALILLALAALVSQFTANAMADLYRNSYLRHGLLDDGAEGDTVREVLATQARARREGRGAVARVLLWFYVRIARQQEGLNPTLAALRAAFESTPDRDGFARRYRELFQPLVPQLAWLGTNVRVLLLFALLPFGAIRAFFWANLTALNLALALLVWAHERRARALLGGLGADEKRGTGVPAAKGER